MNKITMDVNVQGQIFKPFWKKCITAGRAAEGLREDWRMQLKEVQREIGFEYIRFHGLFHEDMMVYKEKEDGTPVYNWQYVDNLFDFLLSVNIRPLLEIGFMPYALASGEGTAFWWKGNTTPPKDYDKWFNLVSELIKHFVNRYGMEEVLTWYFEVWNEPDLINGFWFGTKEEYFKLYEVTVKAVKSVDKRFRVGGPSTSASHGNKFPWVDELLAYCHEKSVPIEFVACHPYPNFWPLDGFGNYIMSYRDIDSTYSDLLMVKDVVEKSHFKNAEIHLTEWNSSPSSRDLVHDTAFMAPFVIYNNLKCIGLADSLGFWTFTDIFEEQRAGDSMFHGGFGMINVQGLKKPAYYGYWCLSRLGSEKLASGDDYFITRKGDSIQILLWNYAYYTDAFIKGDRTMLHDHSRYDIFEEKPAADFYLDLRGLDGDYKVIQYTLDRATGSVFDTWLENGAPEYPSPDELAILKKKEGPDGTIEYHKSLKALTKNVTIQPHGVVLLEIQKLY